MAYDNFSASGEMLDEDNMHNLVIEFSPYNPTQLSFFNYSACPDLMVFINQTFIFAAKYILEHVPTCLWCSK